MASFKLSALITDIKGKMQGTYFKTQNNDVTGIACTIKSTKADAGRSTLQTAQSTFALVSQTWALLNDTQRKAWKSFASSLTWHTKLGTAYTPSSFAVFMQYNINMILVGFGVRYLPRPEKAIGVYNTFSIKGLGLGVWELDTTLEPSEGMQNLLYASAGMSKGATSAKGGYKLLAVVADADLNGTNVFGLYRNVFGDAQLNKNINFKMIRINENSGARGASIITTFATS